MFSIVGAWLAKREGFSVLRRMRDQVDNGVVPTNELIDAALVFAGGVLLFVPGFVTGALGLLLLLPPIRHRGAQRAEAPLPRPRLPARSRRPGPSDVIDV